MAGEDDVLRAVRQTRAFGIVRTALVQADFADLDPGIDGRSPVTAYDGDAALFVARCRLWMGPGELAVLMADLLDDHHGIGVPDDVLQRWCRRALLRWRSQPESERARDVALVAHAGQVDKAGAPYIGHPERVASRQRSDAAVCAAWLHDVVEDTVVSLDDLREGGFDRRVVDAVDALTRRAGETYLDFVRRAAANPVARLVKIADVEDNMDLARLAGADEEALQRARWRVEHKYLPALAILQPEA